MGGGCVVVVRGVKQSESYAGKEVRSLLLLLATLALSLVLLSCPSIVPCHASCSCSRYLNTHLSHTLVCVVWRLLFVFFLT